MTLAEAEKWLAPNLSYEPDEQPSPNGETEVPQAKSKNAG